MSRKNPEISAMFMRASEYNPEVFGHVVSMPKLNGLRCMYLPGKGFFSRSGLRWNDAVLSHIKMPKTEFPIDGELYHHGMLLQEITEAVGVTRLAPGQRAEDVMFYAFDIVKPGKALQRMFDLADVYRDDAANVYASLIVRRDACYNRVALDECYNDYIKKGYEGQMLKSIFGEYMPQGASKAKTLNLQKRKAFLDEEFLCVGVSISKEERMEGLVGALRFVTSSGVEFEVGTGFTRQQRIDWAANPPTGKRGTVKYLYLSAEGVPNNTSFVAWREDI